MNKPTLTLLTALLLATLAALHAADSLVAEPVVLINSAGNDYPIVMQKLFNP